MEKAEDATVAVPNKSKVITRGDRVAAGINGAGLRLLTIGEARGRKDGTRAALAVAGAKIIGKWAEEI